MHVVKMQKLCEAHVCTMQYWQITLTLIQEDDLIKYAIKYAIET